MVLVEVELVKKNINISLMIPSKHCALNTYKSHNTFLMIKSICIKELIHEL